MKPALWIDASAGITGDRFAAALIGLGTPERGLIQAIKDAGEGLGILDAHTHIEFLPDERVAHRLHLTTLEKLNPLPSEDVTTALERTLVQANVTGSYADFAQQSLAILRAAEALINSPLPPAPDKTVSLPVIGTAHTPYQDKAPYQPQPENIGDGTFYIQIAPQYRPAVHSLETFSHIFVLSYLDRALEPELTVRPPWKDSSERYGTFATRSPNRPSPIGLTRTRLIRVEGNRIITGPLDLFDGTPILDIKPFIQSLDGMGKEDDAGNDGWLEGSDHLELHRLGIPHAHPGGALAAYSLYSLMQDPGSACGDFECITAMLPLSNGVMVVGHDYEGMTPSGMDWAMLHEMVGAGLPVPGFLGHSKRALQREKIISAEGGSAGGIAPCTGGAGGIGGDIWLCGDDCYRGKRPDRR